MSKGFWVWFFIGAVVGSFSIQVAIHTINVPESYHEEIITMWKKFPERLSPFMKKFKETNEMTYVEYWKLEKEFNQLARK